MSHKSMIKQGQILLNKQQSVVIERKIFVTFLNPCKMVQSGLLMYRKIKLSVLWLNLRPNCLFGRNAISDDSITYITVIHVNLQRSRKHYFKAYMK